VSKFIPVIEWKTREVCIHDDMIVNCTTDRDIPMINIAQVGSLKPDLHRWACKRDSVRLELAKHGVTNLSGMTELNEKLMRRIAWKDMQDYIDH